MKLRCLCSLVVLSVAISLTANDYDLQKPFGFCTRSSRTSDASQYAFEMTGGGCFEYPVTGVSSSKVITLTSTGKNMKNDIANAIKNYDVIVFDGSQWTTLNSASPSLPQLIDKSKTVIVSIPQAGFKSLLAGWEEAKKTFGEHIK